jgi:hypothetical protein
MHLNPVASLLFKLLLLTRYYVHLSFFAPDLPVVPFQIRPPDDIPVTTPRLQTKDPS